MKLSKCRKILDTKLTERDFINQELTDLKRQSKKLEKDNIARNKAYLFIEQIAVATQKELEFNLNDMVGAGLNSVFDQHYEFNTNFVIKRSRPECNMSFKKGNHLVDPLAFSGLGAADVAAFSLRGASLSMANRYRKVLLLDEPFQRLKGEEENKRVIELMNTLSQKMGIQIICVNDERAARDDIIDGADRVFHITINNNKSKVEVL